MLPTGSDYQNQYFDLPTFRFETFIEEGAYSKPIRTRAGIVTNDVVGEGSRA